MMRSSEGSKSGIPGERSIHTDWYKDLIRPFE
jgi:hypothetical protein